VDESDQRRLALAAKVWRAAKASDDEVDRHVVRVARRLRTARRRQPWRRLLAFFIAVLSFGGALAFAASGGQFLRWAQEVVLTKQASSQGAAALERARPAPLPAKGGVSTVAARPAELGQVHAGGHPAQSAAAVAGDSERAEPSPAPGAGTLAESDSALAEAALGKSGSALAERDPALAGGTPGPASASALQRSSVNAAAAETRLWHTVSEALAKDDLSTAATALRRLATRGSAPTRIKARLGLVQLAVSRGDCDQAERLAKGLANDRSTEDRVVKQALKAARTCFGR
jgi:hypothetical protein